MLCSPLKEVCLGGEAELSCRGQQPSWPRVLWSGQLTADTCMSPHQASPAQEAFLKLKAPSSNPRMGWLLRPAALRAPELAVWRLSPHPAAWARLAPQV